MISKIKNKIVTMQYIKETNRNYNCNVSLKAHIDKESVFEGRNNICAKTYIINSNVGFATYISSNCLFVKTKIGRYCSIGPNVKIIAGNHPTSNYVSTHPLFYTNKSFAGLRYMHNNEFEEYSYVDENKTWLCTIGNDVWIGSDVKILNGINIGDGSIIATGAVVIKDVKPYEIVGGVPARFIKYRFNKQDINFLTKYDIWNKDIEWIQKNAEFFDSIERLKSILVKEKE